MPDFTSGFWSYFIAIVTILSIIGLFWFTLHQSRCKKKKKPGEQVETMGHVWDEDLAEYNNPMPGWWLNLFYITLVWGAIYLLLYPGLGAFSGVLGWSQQDQYQEELQQAENEYGPIFEKYLNQDIEQVAMDPEALEIGKSLFSTYCTTCHGSDARGARGYPNLRDSDWLYGGTPQAIETTIIKGRQGAMPGWESMLDDQKIHDLTSYVIQLAGRDVDSESASRGREIYQANCAVCHGPEGQGNQQLGAPKLTDDIWLYGGSRKKIAESIRLGRSGNMPPHGEFLGKSKVHLLAAYVYSFTHRHRSN
ncbi:MAG: cytochrome-c oxidase, cbb3-type subunit III [Gammaproteobacteria bacterium]|nr:cytochrome-c oxidase, cbb3-type subunit III [Gammaproteobacteria bacterium]